MASPPSAPSSLLLHASFRLGRLAPLQLHHASPSARLLPRRHAVARRGGVINHVAATATTATGVPREVGDDAELRSPSPRIVRPARESPGEIRAAPAVLAAAAPARQGRAPKPPGPPPEGDGGRGGHHN
ncbi:hypothetical protein ACP4OV_029352 [Aristida adscensionis]